MPFGKLDYVRGYTKLHIRLVISVSSILSAADLIHRRLFAAVTLANVKPANPIKAQSITVCSWRLLDIDSLRAAVTKSSL